MSDLNGVAHVILTADDFARSTAFWRDMIGYLGLKLVLDSEHMLYGVGGRTGSASAPAARKTPASASTRAPRGCTMPASVCATAPRSTASTPS